MKVGDMVKRHIIICDDGEALEEDVWGFGIVVASEQSHSPDFIGIMWAQLKRHAISWERKTNLEVASGSG